MRGQPKRRRHRRGPFVERIAGVERAAILDALHETYTESWNVTAAAKALGLPLSTLKWKMQRYNIRRPE
jgi:transcriptional regulator of acetoin/glycerol metabolism